MERGMYAWILKLLAVTMIGLYLPVAVSKSVAVFTEYRKNVTLSTDEPLILECGHVMTTVDINWCFWQYKAQPSSAWEKTLAYDNEHQQSINISKRHSYYNFLNGKSPCLNGVWSKSDIDSQDLVGSYQMVIVAQNGSQYKSPEIHVSEKLETTCPVCVSAPAPAEDKVSGFIAAIVFLVLLIVAMVIILVLYFLGKLPESCLKQLNIPPYKPKQDNTLDMKYEAENERLLIAKKESELQEAVKKLEEFVAQKDKELESYEKDKEENQRLMNQIRAESVVLKDKTEAQALELTALQEENDRLRTDYENQNMVITDLKTKIEADHKPTTKEKLMQAGNLVRNKMTSSFRGSRPFSKAGQASKSDVRMSDISQAFAVGLKDYINLKKDDDLKLEVKLCDNFDTKWFRYGQSAEKFDGVTITNAKRDKDMIKFKVKKRTADMSGVYSCTASKDAVSKTTETLVKIVEGDNESPVFMEWLEDLYVKAGEMAEFSVLVTGNPVPNPVWLHKGKPIDDKGNTKVEITDKASGRLTSILTIDPCEGRDSGDVKVIATNALGSTWCTAQLAVLDTRTPPDFIRGLHNRKAQVGDNVTFSVIVTGNPDPNIEWSNGGKPLLVSDRITVDNTYDGRWKSLLTIRRCTQEDGGLISVNAYNEVSKTFCDAHFTVTD